MFKIKKITSLLAVVAVLLGFATESFAAKKSKTLKNTIKAGFVKCGVSQGLPGFSNADASVLKRSAPYGGDAGLDAVFPAGSVCAPV